jgi:Flp pilus assembly protein TadG
MKPKADIRSPLSTERDAARARLRARCDKNGLGGWRTLMARFVGARRGVTMVEFALVAPLFLLLTFAIVDNGLVLFMQTVLDNATRIAARQIEIGKVQLSGDTDGTGLFKTTLCNNLSGVIPCGSLYWHVQSSSTGFSSLSSTVTSDSSGVMTSTGFNAGTAQSYVLVQVGYTIPYMVPLLARLSGATGNLLLVSSVAVQNEHYQ